jgi:hypothetical protein
LRKAHYVLYAIIHDAAMGDKSLAEMLLGREDVMADLSEATKEAIQAGA